ncbi:hypothetical protein ES705_42922 [subsurface metagenome]
MIVRLNNTIKQELFFNTFFSLQDLILIHFPLWILVSFSFILIIDTFIVIPSSVPTFIAEIVPKGILMVFSTLSKVIVFISIIFLRYKEIPTVIVNTG